MGIFKHNNIHVLYKIIGKKTWKIGVELQFRFLYIFLTAIFAISSVRLMCHLAPSSGISENSSAR